MFTYWHEYSIAAMKIVDTDKIEAQSQTDQLEYKVKVYQMNEMQLIRDITFSVTILNTVYLC